MYSYYQAEWFRLWAVYLQQNGEFYKEKSKHCWSQWLHSLKAQVCGHSPCEIVGSNLARGMDVCMLWVLFVVR